MPRGPLADDTVTRLVREALAGSMNSHNKLAIVLLAVTALALAALAIHLATPRVN